MQLWYASCRCPACFASAARACCLEFCLRKLQVLWITEIHKGITRKRWRNESDFRARLSNLLETDQINRNVRPPARRRLTSDRWMSPEVRKSLENVRCSFEQIWLYLTAPKPLRVFLFNTVRELNRISELENTAYYAMRNAKIAAF